MDARGLSEPELHAVVGLWARSGRTVEARFTGVSMEPSIPHGSTVRLQCGRPPVPGDVVAFVRNGHVLLHRVVARAGGALWTRGDALLVPDPPLAADAPFACVVGVRRGDAWEAAPAHVPSAGQSLVLAACRVAGRLDRRLGRLLSGLLRRLRPPRAPSALELRG